MRDLRDLKNEGEAPAGKKARPVIVIGLLALLVFFVLLLFFRRGDQPQPPPPQASVSPEPAPSKATPDREEEATLKDSTLKPGEMRFEMKKEETPSAITPPPPKIETVSPSAKESVGVIPKEDLTFFKTLKEKEGKGKNSVALTPKKGSRTARAPTAGQERALLSVPGLYTIQVASFSEREGADALARKLRQKGYDAYVTTAELSEKGRWFRVRVGHFSTALEAKNAAEALHRNERLSFFVASEKNK